MVAIRFWDWIRPKDGITKTVEVPCRELFEACAEYAMRDYCFKVCVDMIAAAIGRCEFRTFVENKEEFGAEYYTLNIEPNVNENASQFWHKVVERLYTNNEALIISPRKRGGEEVLVVADSFDPPEVYPTRQNEYSGVVAGQVSYDRPFRERDVLHLKLANHRVKEALDRLYASYEKVIDAAMRHYTWTNGQHWKVHISQIAQGNEDFAETVQKMIAEQVKPFLNSGSAVLPEFDGYAYENAGEKESADTQDMRRLFEDVFDFTARAFLIPPVLVKGSVENTQDANARFLSNCIDPLCDQISEELTRKRYGYGDWLRGSRITVDTSAILHFDLFANAAGIEKLIGSGAYTINDIRRAAGNPLIDEDWASRHWMTKNIADIENAASQIGG